MRTTILVAATFLILPALGTAQDRDPFEARCDAGDLPACNVLGLMYEMGEGAKRNVDRAMGYYRRACEGGEALGCTSVGLLYENRTAVVDDAEARRWYVRACDLDEQLGCDLLQALDHDGPIPEARPFFKGGLVADIKWGFGVPNALVEVQRLGIQAVSDANGRVELGRIPEGTYDLRTEALGYEPTYGVMTVPGYAQFVVLPQAIKWDGPSQPGEIAGSVRDSMDVGLADVEVSIVGESGPRTLTNPDGNFLLTGVAPGLVEVQFALLGYATRTTKMIVQPGGSGRVMLAMSVDAIDLDPIEVSVEERSAYLARVGFYDRARQGIGAQLTAADMDRLNPVRRGGIHVFDILNQLNGVASGPDGIIGTRAGNRCRLQVYVDDMRPGFGAIDPALLATDDVEAIEVYTGIQVPAKYSRVSNCGVVLIWTRRP